MEDEYEESSAWVKEHVEKSTLALDWSARARQEKHALTSALLRVRGKLREEHNKVLREKQKELIDDEEVYMRKRLRDVEMEVNLPNLEIISAILKSFNACFHQTLNGPEKSEYPYLLSVDSTSTTSPVVARLREAAEEVCELASKYVVRKSTRARQGLDHAITGIVNDVDAEGQAMWQTAVSKISTGWQEGGEQYSAFMREMEDKDRAEDNLIQNYILDQTAFAKGLAERELRTRLRTTIEAATLQVKTALRDADVVAKQSRDRLFTMLDQDELNLFEDDKGLSGNLSMKVGELYNRIVAANQESMTLFDEAVAVAKEVAVLRNGRDAPLLHDDDHGELSMLEKELQKSASMSASIN